MATNTTIWHGGNTSDVNLMAALAAMGVSAETLSVHRNGTIHRVWELAKTSHDGKYKTADLLRWWRDESFETTNYEHPFARLKAAMRIRRDIIDGIKKDRPLEFISRGDQIVLINPDCSPETEKDIVGGLE